MHAKFLALLVAVNLSNLTAALTPGPSPAETLDKLTESYAKSPLAPPNYEDVVFPSSAKSPSLTLPDYGSAGSSAPTPGLKSKLPTLLAREQPKMASSRGKIKLLMIRPRYAYVSHS